MNSSWIYFSLFAMFTVAGMFTASISAPFVAIVGTLLISLSFIVRPAFKKETLKENLLQTQDQCSTQITACDPNDAVKTCQQLCYGTKTTGAGDKIYECTKVNSSASKLAHEDSLKYACVQKKGKNDYTKSSQVFCNPETGYNFLAGRQKYYTDDDTVTNLVTGWDCICAYPEWFGVTTVHADMDTNVVTRCKMPNPGVCMGPIHNPNSLDAVPLCDFDQILLTSGQEHPIAEIVEDPNETPQPPWILSPFDGFWICPPGNCYSATEENGKRRFFCSRPSDDGDAPFYSNPRPGQLPNFNQCVCASNYRRYVDSNGIPICIPVAVDEDIVMDIHSVGSSSANSDGTRDSKGSGSCSASCPGGNLCTCPKEEEMCVDGACVEVKSFCSTTNETGLCPMDKKCVKGLCQ